MSETLISARCELARAESQHVTELGRILYEAFKDIHHKHGFPLEYPTAIAGSELMFMLVHRKDFYGVVAISDGKLVGSNFLLVADAVAGIGPLSVDPALQGRGIARVLMEDVIQYAERQGLARVRLMQETFNHRALSLYASLGFDAKEQVAFFQAAPAKEVDRSIRAVTRDDLAAVDRLCINLYRVSRRNETAAAVRYGSSPLLRERNGKVVGYLVPGINGHGVAE
jgi:GNAT superfamily N-acetyltransferase